MAKRRLRGSQGDPRHRALASWIFGSILLAAILLIFFFAPEYLPAYKQPIVLILAALLCGFLAYFFTGTIGVQFSWLKATGTIAVVIVVLVAWKQFIPAPPGLFRVTVALLDSQGRPLTDAELRASFGQLKKIDVGYEVDIPTAALPKDHWVTFYATKPSALLSGQQTLLLRGDDLQPSVSLTLRPGPPAPIAGTVQDLDGAALAGANVDVTGYENEATQTSTTGSFRLATHAPAGKSIRLHGEKPGYAPVDQDDQAGNTAVTLRPARR